MAIEFSVDEIVSTLEKELIKDVREIGFRILQTATLATPVGNPERWQNPNSAPPGYVGGHARRNWQVGVQSPPPDEIEGTDASGGSTVSEGRAVIQAYSRLHDMWIVNNVPYIGRLNDGHSTAAPAGFVENSIDAAVRAASAPRNI